MAKGRFGTRSIVLFATVFFPIPTLNAQAVRPVPAAPGAEPQPAVWGLGALIHPLQLDEVNFREQVRAIPQDQKDRVHFFLINGLDPLWSGNLNGLAAYFRSIGFVNTTCYQFPATPKVRQQIETLRRNDPDARIVLLGFSVGANCVRGLANSLQRDGVAIDALIYLGGDTVFNTPASKPANVGHVVNITGHGLILLGRDLYFKGEDIDGAVNRRMDVRHINLPNRQETINLIGRELIALANGTAGAQRPAEPPAVRGVSLGAPIPDDGRP
jgi:hypothetical protein